MFVLHGGKEMRMRCVFNSVFLCIKQKGKMIMQESSCWWDGFRGRV